MSEKKADRKQQILESFAEMLETQPGGRITTAALARQVGVSEAALYRHFPSKARMFEGLIEFIEDSVLSRVPRIAAVAELTAADRCGQLLHFVLAFSAHNPGMTRLLTGDVLAGETPRLRARTQQFQERLETQLRQWLREAETRGQLRLRVPLAATVDLMVALVMGKLGTFARTDFKRAPTEHFDHQWRALAATLFEVTALPAGTPDQATGSLDDPSADAGERLQSGQG